MTVCKIVLHKGHFSVFLLEGISLLVGSLYMEDVCGVGVLKTV